VAAGVVRRLNVVRCEVRVWVGSSIDGTIGYIVGTDESFGKRRCLRCEVRKGFP